MVDALNDRARLAVAMSCIFTDEPAPHVDCEVVAVCGCQGFPAGFMLPAVCPCECSPCKRAWWAMGRPRVVNGKVVRE